MKYLNIRHAAKNIEVSPKFSEEIDSIMNRQIILFIKHYKINMKRIIDDEGFDEGENLARQIYFGL